MKRIVENHIGIAVRIISVCLIAAILTAMIITREPLQLKSFDYNQYRVFIEGYSGNCINLGSIDNKEKAIEKAELVWQRQFGTDMLKEIQHNEQPFSVRYNSEKKMWLITGSMEPNTVGGVAGAIIGGDGTVLAIWHGK